MSVYRFKVTFEEHDDVSREIDILSEQTFDDFHMAILRSIMFTAEKGASFFMSNDHWGKGEEISLEEITGPEGKPVSMMKDAVLRDYINDPHQKIYYVFDYKAQWTFLIELIRIFPEAGLAMEYPCCVKSTGEAPKQKAVPPLPKGVREEETPEEETAVVALETEAEADINIGDEAETESELYEESDTEDMDVERFGDEEKEFNPDET